MVNIEALSAKQLSEKYPLPPNPESSGVAWHYLLQVWREAKPPHGGKLMQRIHYKTVQVDGFLKTVYNHKRVAELIVREGKFKGARPRIKYLYEQYHDQWCELIASNSSNNFIAPPQDIPA